MAVHYRNADGVCFDIKVENANVPRDADYWHYWLIAEESQTRRAHAYRAMVRKNQCPTKEEADRFLEGKPMRYLESAILDRYSDGATPLLWPDVSSGWVVV
jgi:hypothetical protein